MKLGRGSPQLYYHDSGSGRCLTRWRRPHTSSRRRWGQAGSAWPRGVWLRLSVGFQPSPSEFRARSALYQRRQPIRVHYARGRHALGLSLLSRALPWLPPLRERCRSAQSGWRASGRSASTARQPEARSRRCVAAAMELDGVPGPRHISPVPVRRISSRDSSLSRNGRSGITRKPVFGAPCQARQNGTPLWRLPRHHLALPGQCRPLPRFVPARTAPAARLQGS